VDSGRPAFTTVSLLAIEQCVISHRGFLISVCLVSKYYYTTKARKYSGHKTHGSPTDSTQFNSTGVGQFSNRGPLAAYRAWDFPTQASCFRFVNYNWLHRHSRRLIAPIPVLVKLFLPSLLL